MDSMYSLLVIVDMMDSAVPGVSVPSVSSCISMCFYNRTCSSFFYDFNNNTCHQAPVAYTLLPDFLPYPRINYYEFQHDACPEGWSYFMSIGQCLMSGFQRKYYIPARNYCVKNGGQLVIINNAVENNIVRRVAEFANCDRGLWIGLMRIAKNDFYQWESGQRLGEFTDWRVSYPNPARRCGVMDGDWITAVPAYRARPFLCTRAVNMTDYCS